MPPLLYPPPLIVDQSFPRDRADLLMVAKAMGRIMQLMEEDRLHLVLSSAILVSVDRFCWDPSTPGSLLSELWTLLARLCLQPSEAVVRLDLAGERSEARHPVPCGTGSCELVDRWAEDAARLLSRHERRGAARPFCVGIACAHGFAGEHVCAYVPEGAAALPLVGPLEAERLGDAYRWVTRTNVHTESVSYADVEQNCHVLGGEFSPPFRDSHAKVTFAGRTRPWTVDSQYDVVPEPHLGELKDLLGLPTDVIRQALIDGQMPAQRTCILAGTE